MGSTQDTDELAGTKDEVYNLIWFTEASLSNALRLEGYISDAELNGDNELAEFFRKAHRVNQKGGELGKNLLASRLRNKD